MKFKEPGLMFIPGIVGTMLITFAGAGAIKTSQHDSDPNHVTGIVSSTWKSDYGRYAVRVVTDVTATPNGNKVDVSESSRTCIEPKGVVQSLRVNQKVSLKNCVKFSQTNVKFHLLSQSQDEENLLLNKAVSQAASEHRAVTVRP